MIHFSTRTAGGVDKPKRGRPIQRVSRRGTRGQGRPAARRGRPPKLKGSIGHTLQLKGSISPVDYFYS